MPLESPAGDMAGASAMKTLTWSFSFGWKAREANACAVPWEKPMYDSDCWPVADRMYPMLSGMA